MSLLFEEETYKILGAGFEVYNTVGPGFLEAVYHECLSIELKEREIPTQSQIPLTLRYKNSILNQRYIPDFICFGQVIVEIKAVKILAAEHRAQTINYLKVTNLPLALLLNFGSHPKLEHERFINNPCHPRDP